MTVEAAGVAVASGACVDERYRLDGMLTRGDGSSLWSGTDELLKRPVVVQVFESATARAPDVFDAVRRASRLTHSGLAQVFDANEQADPPFLVREWIAGRDLATVLADGPLHPRRVADTVRQASDALAAGHAAGVHHLRLTPRSVVWSGAGRVKVVGLGVDAALTRSRADDPQRADTQALARLLRIAMSARWARGDSVVRPTPTQAMRAWTARHRGIGRELVSIARQALYEEPPPGTEPIQTPGQLAAALRRVAPTLGGAAEPRAVRPGIGGPRPAVARMRQRADTALVSTEPFDVVGTSPPRDVAA